MSDITKCNNTDCPLAKSCFRLVDFTISTYQSYARFEPIIDEVLDEVECRMYIDKSTMLPQGFKVYKCTDCKETNVLKDNGQITVGFCSNCKHPLWN